MRFPGTGARAAAFVHARTAAGGTKERFRGKGHAPRLSRPAFVRLDVVVGIGAARRLAVLGAARLINGVVVKSKISLGE